ncbi:MAG: hypothetical protein RLZZ65_1897 [Bacteroidota bacterium]|jgi:peptide/nickel transport system substrate-binding protein
MRNNLTFVQMSKRKTIIVVGVLFLIVGLFWIIPKPRPAAKGDVIFGGKLRFSSAESFSVLFPLSSNTLDYHRVQQLIYEPILVAADNSRGWNYNLANHITASANHKEITISLRQDVYFATDACFRFESRELTADDLAFTLSYACSNEIENQQEHLLIELIEGADRFFQNKENPLEKTVSGIKIIDPYTLKIALTGSYNHFLPLLSNNSLGVLSKTAASYYQNNFIDHPIGTGAFYLDSKSKGILLFKRNKDYWKKDRFGNQLPYLDEVEVCTGVSGANEHRLFSENKSDLLFDLPVNQLQSAFGTLQDAQKGKNPLHEVYIRPSSKIHYIYFNALKKPFDNPAVRKAFSLVIDPVQICMNDLNGEGSPMQGKFIPVRKGYKNELLLTLQKSKTAEGSRNEAKLLLSKAGFDKNHPFPIVNLAVNGDKNGVAAAWCRAIQKMLKDQLNIKVVLLYNEQTKNLSSQKDIDIWRGGWVGDYPGGESYLRLFYSAAQKPMFYKNQKVDNYYLSSIFADAQSPSHKLYQKLCEKEIIEDNALIPIYTEDFFVLNKLTVRGFELEESGIVDFSKIYLKPI